VHRYTYIGVGTLEDLPMGEFIKLNRMYIEFEFINTSDHAILQAY
jgi:hypothetical protein